MKGINQDLLFEFFHDEKITKILDEVYRLAISSKDESIRLKASKEILNRVMGRPTESMDLNVTEGFKPIIVGLKDDREPLPSNS